MQLHEANLELLVLESEAKRFSSVDFDAQFLNAGLPSEVVFRLKELWGRTSEIGGRVVDIGKLVLTEIYKFIRENPNLAIGTAIGVAVGALVNLVPFLGPILAPLATVLGLAIGALAGSRLDGNDVSGNGNVGLAQEAIIIARKFFELFARIFNVLPITI